MCITITVNIDQIKQMSDFICHIDEQKDNRDVLIDLIEKAHTCLINMLGKYEFMVYAPEDEAVTA